MKMYYLKHKETGELLRIFSYETGDSEFNNRYVLTDFKHSLVWMVPNIEDIHFIIDKYKKGHDIQPEYSIKCNLPSYGEVKLEEYEINDIIL
jgi:hypothetical protein